MPVPFRRPRLPNVVKDRVLQKPQTMQGFVASGLQAWRHRQRTNTKRPAGNEGDQSIDERMDEATTKREKAPELRMLTSACTGTKDERRKTSC